MDSFTSFIGSLYNSASETVAGVWNGAVDIAGGIVSGYNAVIAPLAGAVDSSKESTVVDNSGASDKTLLIVGGLVLGGILLVVLTRK